MNNEELVIKDIEKIYPLKISSIKLLKEGPDNYIWLAEDKERKRYSVRISKRIKETDELAFEADWLKFLGSKKVPVPEVILTKNQKTNAILSNRSPITCFRFIEGETVGWRIGAPDPSAVLVSSAGRALALIHKVSRNGNLGKIRKRNIYTEFDRFFTQQDRVTAEMKGGRKIMEEIKEMTDWARNTNEDNSLIHNDYHSGNIIVENDKVKSVLDFDWSCIGPSIKDLSHALSLVFPR